jgi:hypothetical protein
VAIFGDTTATGFGFSIGGSAATTTKGSLYTGVANPNSFYLYDVDPDGDVKAGYIGGFPKWGYLDGAPIGLRFADGVLGAEEDVAPFIKGNVAGTFAQADDLPFFTALTAAGGVKVDTDAAYLNPLSDGVVEGTYWYNTAPPTSGGSFFMYVLGAADDDGLFIQLGEATVAGGVITQLEGVSGSLLYSGVAITIEPVAVPSSPFGLVNILGTDVYSTNVAGYKWIYKDTVNSASVLRHNAAAPTTTPLWTVYESDSGFAYDAFSYDVTTGNALYLGGYDTSVSDELTFADGILDGLGASVPKLNKGAPAALSNSSWVSPHASQGSVSLAITSGTSATITIETGGYVDIYGYLDGAPVKLADAENLYYSGAGPYDLFSISKDTTTLGNVKFFGIDTITAKVGTDATLPANASMIGTFTVGSLATVGASGAFYATDTTNGIALPTVFQGVWRLTSTGVAGMDDITITGTGTNTTIKIGTNTATTFNLGAKDLTGTLAAVKVAHLTNFLWDLYVVTANSGLVYVGQGAYTTTPDKLTFAAGTTVVRSGTAFDKVP